MYQFILTLHNLTRWVVVIAGIFLLVRAIFGLLYSRPWQNRVNRIALVFTGAFDLQVLFGLILYFFYSPITRPALSNFSAAMSNPVMRFFTVEHISLMLIALILAHIGSAQVKKAAADKQKYTRILLWFGLAFVLLMLAIPWPFSAVDRPLLRLMNFVL